MSERAQSHDEVESFHLLYVCTGNSCRSPMAEVITRSSLIRRGWHHVDVASAGTAAFGSAPASGGATRTAAAHGLDLADHITRGLAPEVVEWADLILVMAPHHLHAIVDLGAGDRTAVITDFAEGRQEGEEPGEGVRDPYGGGDDEYGATFEELAGLVERLLGRLEPIVAP